jgi:hypothetical protein
LKVTVQETLPAFVGFAPARLIEDASGAVRSTTHEYELTPLALPLLSIAFTWKVYDPSASGLDVDPYVFGLVHVVNAAPFRLHW